MPLMVEKAFSKRRGEGGSHRLRIGARQVAAHIDGGESPFLGRSGDRQVQDAEHAER